MRYRCKYNLKALVSKMPKDYQTEELNWGKAVDKET
tara:strand:+ start:463 stop:570 length:108 start_codon:yes stop_codon:yes gene_type:complete